MQQLDNAFFDFKRFAEALPVTLFPNESFDDVLTDVKSQPLSYDDRSEDGVYTKKKVDNTLVDVNASQDKSFDDIHAQHISISADDLDFVTAFIQSGQYQVPLDHVMGVVEHIVVEYVNATKSALSKPSHYYQLSRQLGIPLDIAFKQTRTGIEITIYSEGNMKAALAAGSDDLLKRLQKRLQAPDISIAIQSMSRSPLSADKGAPKAASL